MKAVKSVLRSWVLEVLRFLARRELARVKPRIVGITGSAGKTSSKEAIFDVLARRLKTRKSEKNLNTEFGTVLAVLGEKSGYASVRAWLGILWRACVKSVKKPEDYESLVLEMAVDKPGDMDEILKVIRPDVMVFLNVKGEHLDEGQFANRQAIFEEKSRAVYAVPAEGWVVLNKDDNFVKQIVDKVPANVVTIGFSEGCDLQAKDVKTGVDGLEFVLAYEGKEHEVHLPNILGECHVYGALAAIAVAFIHGMPWKTIEVALEEFYLPPGRMNKIDGKNGSVIIDSSYNASPDSMEAALEVLGLFEGRKIAALGTMNELGELTESAHLKVGKLAAGVADELIAVGVHAKSFAEGARREGMDASLIHVFGTSKEAGAFLEKTLERGDAVLAKGSQNKVRMEHLVKACMKEPEQARNLLVRQEPFWLRKY
jgi:UDP-N-acetylmuramoyl-tripeptide--D-alanyl-D-alanine ligase